MSSTFVSYVGRLFVKANGKPVEVLTKLNELAGFSPDEEIELFEVSDDSIVGGVQYFLFPRLATA